MSWRSWVRISASYTGWTLIMYWRSVQVYSGLWNKFLFHQKSQSPRMPNVKNVWSRFACCKLSSITSNSLDGNICKTWAVLVAQWAGRSLLTLENPGSNPVIINLYWEFIHFPQFTKYKRPDMAHLKTFLKCYGKNQYTNI